MHLRKEWPLPLIEPRFLACPARSPLALSNTNSRFLCVGGVLFLAKCLPCFFVWPNEVSKLTVTRCGIADRVATVYASSTVS
jgi:hypothetical protein